MPFIEVNTGTIINTDAIETVELMSRARGGDRTMIKMITGQSIESAIPFAELTRKLKAPVPTTSASQTRV